MRVSVGSPSVPSCGEKAIALHLPLFAARRGALPRGTDGAPAHPARRGVRRRRHQQPGQVFALLSALDLDLLLTSDHEWCTYPELPGVAIHQLITGNDAVTTARFVWDGRDLLADESQIEGDDLR